MNKSFEFNIQVKGKQNFDIDSHDVGSDDFAVALPHSCDDWVIASSKDKGEVIAKMEQFIKEANEALGQIKSAK